MQATPEYKKIFSIKDMEQLLPYAVSLAFGFAAMAVLHFAPAGSFLSALCAVFAPFFFLYGIRHANGIPQIIIAGVVFAAGLTMMNAGYCPSVWLDILVFVLSAVWIFPAFLIDRCYTEKDRHFLTTLIFPTAWVALFQLSTLIHLGFQFRLEVFVTYFSPLTQVSSIFGTSGLLFLLLWSASVAIYVIENFHSFCRIGVGIWFAVLAGCLVFGAIRTQTSIFAGQSVRISYTTGPYNGDFITYENLSYDQYASSAARSVAAAAEDGAEVIVFNEEAFCIRDTDGEKLSGYLSSLAKKYGIHILAGAEISDTDNSNNGKSLNCVAWFSSDGEVLFRYVKHSLVPVVESNTCTPGTDDLPSATVHFNAGDVNIAAAICFDSNFSTYIYSIPKDTQLLFLPSWDWDGVSDFHGEICRLLAIENGVTLLKDTYDGISAVYSPTGETLYTSDTSTDGFETLHTVDVPLWRRTTALQTVWSAVSDLFAADDTAAEPSQVQTDGTMSHYAIIVIACDAMAILIMAILLYALFFEDKDKDAKTNYFILCCICTILSLITDILAWAYEDKPGHDTLLYAVNLLCLLYSLGIVAFVPFYEIETIGRKDHVSGIHAVIITVLCGMAALLITVGVFTGKTFTVSNGVFTYGPWYSISSAVSMAMLIYMVSLAIIKRKYLGKHDTLAFCCYMVLPLVAVVWTFFDPDLNLVLPATALSASLLYVMLQSGNVSALHLRGELLNELSYQDIMTGLQNRRAYDEALSRYSTETVLDVIFCDVNGLKFINDTLGHAAGDERLKRFANLLKRHFSSDSCFRISGDEFVVLIPKLAPDSFRSRVETFQKEVAMMEDIAAVGFASGAGADAAALIAQAENSMYEDKEACRRLHPEFTR